MSTPVYLVGDLPEEMGLAGEHVGETVRLPDPTTLPADSHEAGWILISDRVEPGQVLALLVRLSDTAGAWSPLLVRTDVEGGPVLVPLSPGWPTSPDEVEDRIREGGSAAGYLSYRLAMGDLSRVRHDINNPLTAALAEVQLTLLDIEEGSEVEDSLRVVEAQIRRIRDLVKGLTRYRTPRP